MIPVPNDTPTQHFAVLGSGTWGLTLGDLLARNGHAVCCWDVDEDLLHRLDRERTHPKLDEFAISPELRFDASLAGALDGARVVVLVVPSVAMRQACGAVKSTGLAAAVESWVICSKGIEQGTLMLMHEVLADVLGQTAGARTGLFSGPSHAEEVCRGLPTTVVGCASDPELATRIQAWFFRPTLRVYSHDDVMGVELGAAIKNVIAIAAGVCEGLKLGDNARAALMTRGLAEIVRLGLARGARLETFLGLSGVGDLIVTAGSRHSRNHKFGRLLAEGLSAQDALDQVGMVVEGYTTARSARALALREGVEMPITEIVYQMLYEGVGPRQALEELMSRDPKPEHY